MALGGFLSKVFKPISSVVSSILGLKTKLPDAPKEPTIDDAQAAAEEERLRLARGSAGFQSTLLGGLAEQDPANRSYGTATKELLGS